MLIKVLKYMSTETSTLLIIGLLYLLVVSFCFLMASIYKFECSTNAYLGISGPLYILTFPILCNILLFFFDFYMHFKKIRRCKFKEIFIKSDPLRYRAEQIFGIFSLLFLLPTLTYLLITTPILSSKDENIIFGFSVYGINFHPYLISLSFYALYLYLYGFITALTIYRQFREKCLKKKKPNPDELYKIFNDPTLKELFFDFCRLEWSLENFAIFDEIETFKKKPSLEKAFEIYDKYLNGIDSKCEVNIPVSACQEIKHKLGYKFYEANMFETVQKFIETNLTDTYTRFVFTTEYQNWVKNDQIIKENQ